MKKYNSKINTFIDLFCGIGGFHAAAANLGLDCVFASDIDKKARTSYYKNYKLKPSGDITKIKAKNIPDFDLLCGGFPCQPFSSAGKRKGINDHRGNLFFEIVRILKAKKPEAFLLENVVGLTTIDKGNTFRRVLFELQSLGYCVQWKILNTIDYGLPQSRPRLFIVGIKKFVLFSWPKSKPMQPLKEILDDSLKESIPKLSPSIKKVMENYRKKYKYIKRLQIWHRAFDNSCAVKPYAHTLLAGSHKDHVVDGKRHLYIRERLRLQGFPENFKICHASYGTMVSQTGNAVSVPVIKAIIKQIMKTVNRR
jgi:DNA (cytosine-5)-methyltransferase 1